MVVRAFKLVQVEMISIQAKPVPAGNMCRCFINSLHGIPLANDHHHKAPIRPLALVFIVPYMCTLRP